MLCTMEWTPFADKCKLLLCAFVNWLGFSLTFLTKPLQKKPSGGTVFPQACSRWCWSGAYLHGMGSSPWVWCLEFDPSATQSACPCCLQSWCTSGLWCLCLLIYMHIRLSLWKQIWNCLMLAFCIVQKLTVIPSNPGCWRRHPFQGQYETMWVGS